MLQDNQPVLQLINIYKSFGDNAVIKDISIDIYEGELVTFIGPSGCGKTTLLRIIGGFHPQDYGQVILDGQSIDDLPPERRATGMVFQNYALFPHMTIYDNIAYGLDIQKIAKKEKDKLVKEALSQVRLNGYEHRKPSELSGGQQQRVAIARCLVLKPKVLLLDEPLSNLDANLRMIMRDEILRLKAELNLTIIFVTHDQDEALSISDRVLVMNDGELQQLATPTVIYQQPKNEFVANFVGHANLLTGKAVVKGKNSYFVTENLRFPFETPGIKAGMEMKVLIRPEMIKINGKSNLIGKVENMIYHGSYIRYFLKVGKQSLLVDDYNVEANELIDKGSSVGISLPKSLHVIERDAETKLINKQIAQ